METLINNGTVIINTEKINNYSFTPECLVIIQEFHGETTILMDSDGCYYNVKGNKSSKEFDRLVLYGEHLRKESLPTLTEEFINDYDFSWIE